VQRGKINFLRKNKRRTDDIFFSWRQLYWFRPQFIYIVILVPAVPLVQETEVFCAKHDTIFLGEKILEFFIVPTEKHILVSWRRRFQPFNLEPKVQLASLTGSNRGR
jgi:hypothetical protein